MANKSANVAARVEPEIKEKAESILAGLGIPASVGINMFYRQVIYSNGLPFQPVLPNPHPQSRDEMTKEEFDARMLEGLKQAQADDSTEVKEVINRLIGELSNG